MWSLIGGLLLSVALISAPVAIACPIDLAPCDQAINPRVTSIDAQIDQLILASPVFRTDHDVLLSIAAEVDTTAGLQDLVLLNHEDDTSAVPNAVVTDIPQDEDDSWDLSGMVPSANAMADYATVYSRKFLLEDDDLIYTEFTGTVLGTSTDHPVSGQPELAVEGYEDR